jgi:hypothetical protein
MVWEVSIGDRMSPRSNPHKLATLLLLGTVLCWGDPAGARTVRQRLRAFSHRVQGLMTRKPPITQKQLDARLKPVKRTASKVKGFFRNGKIFRGQSTTNGLGVLTSIGDWWPLMVGTGVGIGAATDSRGRTRYSFTGHAEGGGLGLGALMGLQKSVSWAKRGTPLRKVMPLASVERTEGGGAALLLGAAVHEVAQSSNSALTRGTRATLGTGMMIHGGEIKGVHLGQLTGVNLSIPLPVSFDAPALRSAKKASRHAALAQKAMSQGRPRAAERHLNRAERALDQMKQRLSSRDRGEGP